MVQHQCTGEDFPTALQSFLMTTYSSVFHVNVWSFPKMLMCCQQPRQKMVNHCDKCNGHIWQCQLKQSFCKEKWKSMCSAMAGQWHLIIMPLTLALPWHFTNILVQWSTKMWHERWHSSNPFCFTNVKQWKDSEQEQSTIVQICCTHAANKGMQMFWWFVQCSCSGCARFDDCWGWIFRHCILCKMHKNVSLVWDCTCRKGWGSIWSSGFQAPPTLFVWNFCALSHTKSWSWHTELKHAALSQTVAQWMNAHSEWLKNLKSHCIWCNNVFMWTRWWFWVVWLLCSNLQWWNAVAFSVPVPAKNFWILPTHINVSIQSIFRGSNKSTSLLIIT